MSKPRWKAFPHADAAYDYSGTKLAKAWPRLHRGDCEPFPDPVSLRKLVAAYPQLKPAVSLDRAAATLADAWRAYHRGDFGQAAERGLGLGLLGYNVANKAANIYATYLETGPKAKLALFMEAARRAGEVLGIAENLPNAWYLHAQALGRYAQSLSVTQALAEGLGGKIKADLDQAIALERRHADAHIALGAYHAEVIDKIGSFLGGLTYGASTDAGVKHFKTALRLNPDSAIARIEYAEGLIMMFGEAKEEQAAALYAEAAACVAADAMERLDVERAKAKLSD
jgi:hypothetical protein